MAICLLSFVFFLLVSFIETLDLLQILFVLPQNVAQQCASATELNECCIKIYVLSVAKRTFSFISMNNVVDSIDPYYSNTEKHTLLYITCTLYIIHYTYIHIHTSLLSIICPFLFSYHIHVHRYAIFGSLLTVN